MLVWEERLVLIDFPQAVDPISNPDGLALLERDVTNVCTWFGRQGIDCDASALFASLLSEII
jgi:RIO kinase 1